MHNPSSSAFAMLRNLLDYCQESIPDIGGKIGSPLIKYANVLTSSTYIKTDDSYRRRIGLLIGITKGIDISAIFINHKGRSQPTPKSYLHHVPDEAFASCPAFIQLQIPTHREYLGFCAVGYRPQLREVDAQKCPYEGLDLLFARVYF